MLAVEVRSKQSSKVQSQSQAQLRAIEKLIEQPGLQMSLGEFFDKWIYRLYGIEKHQFAVQRGTDFRTGFPIQKTWRQACYFELEKWGFSYFTAKGWGSDWESAPKDTRRVAYFMHQILEAQREQASRQKTGNYHY